MALDHIKLCTDCCRRAVSDADADHRLIPCGAHPDKSLTEARAQCQGSDWRPYTAAGKASGSEVPNETE